MSVAEDIHDTRAEMMALGVAAKGAAKALATASTAQKDQALHAMAGQIRQRVDDILSANAGDVALAQTLDRRASFIDRLTLTAERIEAMAQGVENIAGLPDPVGGVIAEWTQPNGLRISRVRTPIGVIGIIY